MINYLIHLLFMETCIGNWHILKSNFLYILFLISIWQLMLGLFICKTKCSVFQIFTYRVNKKIPRGPPSPPAPVMHSPNRKVCYLKSIISEQVNYICVFYSASDNNNTSCRFVGHCERTARMEDSTLYLKLEKCQGTEIQNCFFFLTACS